MKDHKIQSLRMQVVVAVVLVCGLLAWLVNQVDIARDRGDLGSCVNHGNHARISFSFDDLEAPPHDPDLKGYEALAVYQANSTYTAGVNCNFGAPKSRYGGWQALNLSPEQYLELNKRFPFEALSEAYLLYGWCGRPSRIPERIAFSMTIGMNEEGQMTYHLFPTRITEDELDNYIEELNKVFNQMGVPPIEKDIPEDVDWSQYGAQN